MSRLEAREANLSTPNKHCPKIGITKPQTRNAASLACFSQAPGLKASKRILKPALPIVRQLFHRAHQRLQRSAAGGGKNDLLSRGLSGSESWRRFLARCKTSPNFELRPLGVSKLKALPSVRWRSALGSSISEMTALGWHSLISQSKACIAMLRRRAHTHRALRTKG